MQEFIVLVQALKDFTDSGLTVILMAAIAGGVLVYLYLQGKALREISRECHENQERMQQRFIDAQEKAQNQFVDELRRIHTDYMEANKVLMQEIRSLEIKHIQSRIRGINS